MTIQTSRRFGLPPHQGDLPPLSEAAKDLYSRFVYWWEPGDNVVMLPSGLRDSIEIGIWDAAIAQLQAAGLVEVY
jgi:hypothetical protein